MRRGARKHPDRFQQRTMRLAAAAWDAWASQETSHAAWGKRRWKRSLFLGTVEAGRLIRRLLAEVTACVPHFCCPSEKDGLVFSFKEIYVSKNFAGSILSPLHLRKPCYKASVSPSSSIWEATQYFAESKQFSCIPAAVSSTLQNNKPQLSGRADTIADAFQNTIGLRIF